MMYKKVVQQIIGLEWDQLEEQGLLTLMVLSAYTASEFAESLRLALALYPKNKGLKTMAAGELMTNNLRFGSYRQTNDHAAFLWHFLPKRKLLTPPAGPRGGGQLDTDWNYKEAERYHREVRLLSPEVRAMTIFSREKELPAIFARILSSPQKNWKHPALQAYRYYLKQHIKLDSAAGGHQELIANFPVTDAVVRYYELRRRLYEWTIFYHESPGD